MQRVSRRCGHKSLCGEGGDDGIKWRRKGGGGLLRRDTKRVGGSGCERGGMSNQQECRKWHLKREGATGDNGEAGEGEDESGNESESENEGRGREESLVEVKFHGKARDKGGEARDWEASEGQRKKERAEWVGSE